MEAILPALALLACPVIMGACMWIMSRSHRRPGVEPMRKEAAPSIVELRAEQRRLVHEIERLEAAELDRDTDQESDERAEGVVGRS